MKLKNYVLFFCLVLFASACNKDPELDPTGNMLVGTWQATEIYCDDGIGLLDGITYQTYSFEGKNITSKITLNDDQTFTSEGSYIQAFTLYFFGDPEPIEYEIPHNDFAISGTWSNTDSTMTFLNDGSPINEPSEILEITDTKLRLKYRSSLTVSEGGSSVTQNSTIFYTLEKQ